MQIIKKQQLGVSIFLAVMILTSVLAVGLGVTAIILPQLKITENIDNSVKAVFAADTGIECKLMEIRQGIACSPAPLSNAATYTVTVTDNTLCSGAALTGNKAVKSIGTYKNVRRSLCVDQQT